MAAGRGTIEVAAPEPGLSGAELVRRAAALTARVRAEQDEAERRGRYSEGLHQAFVEAGLYRMVQPRRFGGYECDIPSFWQAMVHIAAGDPGTGWCLTLGSHHAWLLGSHWPERAQRELFGPSGDFRGPHRPIPGGTAEPVEGGYLVSGTWDYCSGVPYATHFIGNALLPPPESGPPPLPIVVVIPRAQFRVLDDWGGGAQLGMQSSGSQSVSVERVFVPEHLVLVGDWTGASSESSPGAALHGNPMYLGKVWGIYHGGLVVAVVGAAKAALSEFEQIITTRKTLFPPQVVRVEHYDYQRAWGLARGLIDSAEALLYHTGERYMELCWRWAEQGQPFSLDDDNRLFGMLQQAGRMASEAVELLFSSGGSSAAKRGQRLQRYFRDVAMYRGHVAAQSVNFASGFAKSHFGLAEPPRL